MNDDEITLSEKQRKIVESIVSDIFSENSDLYYASTMDIAHVVIERLEKSENISESDKELMEGLSSHDIQNLLSYSSNCC